MTEQWKQIPSLPSYEASDRGNIRSRKGLSCRAIKPAVGGRGGGYYRFRPSVDGIKSNRMVHHVVIEAFVGPRPVGLHVAHLDGNSLNNDLSNLAYVTQSENEAHKVVHRTRPIGEGHYRHKLSADQVAEIRRSYVPRSPENSAAALARRFGVAKGTIQRLLRRASWDLAGSPEYAGTAPGVRYGQKLSEADVLAICRSDEKLQVLADRYGVSISHLSNLRNGRPRARKTAPEAARRERLGIWR